MKKHYLLLVGITITIFLGSLLIWFNREAGQTDNQPVSRFTDQVYAGSNTCRDCHESEFALWQESHHALAERMISVEQDRFAFTPERAIETGSHTFQARMEEEQFEMLLQGPDGESQVFQPVRVLGETPLRQFLIPFDQGRIQVTELAVDPESGEWFNVFGSEDRQPGEWGHWTGRGMNWNSMCGYCHNTGYSKNYDLRSDSYATTMAEMGVGCEACHGPMEKHVSWQQEYPGERNEPTVARLSARQLLDTCGICHARRTELTERFLPGDDFLDHFTPVIPDATDIYYADGQVREENYEYISFLGSRMHAAGVTCMDCHNPHSGRLVTSGNQLCMNCHAGQQPAAAVVDEDLHTHHQPGVAGSNCVDCHMPVTVYMQKDARRDHGFTIPDPLLTRDYGIPNACNRCHAEESAEWALKAVEEWYGDRMERHTRERARWIAQARMEQSNAVPGLLEMLKDEALPVWRASAALILRDRSMQPEVREELLNALSDPSPIVRGMIARSLEPLAGMGDSSVRDALRKQLDDPARMVRIESAWALRDNIRLESAHGKELVHYLNLNLDQPTGALQMAAFQLDRGNPNEALRYCRMAVERDPRSAPLRHELAVVLSQNGQPREALKELEEAVRLDPREALYRFKLALAWNELGDLTRAVEALQAAVRLEPRYGRAWYNLGLAYSTLGDLQQSLDALQRAERLLPDDPEIPYALATILARQGLHDRAREAALRALEIDPSYSPAQRLVQMLPSQ